MWQNRAAVIYEVNISTLEIVLILYNDALSVLLNKISTKFEYLGNYRSDLASFFKRLDTHRNAACHLSLVKIAGTVH